jgi:hypothetical protein
LCAALKPRWGWEKPPAPDSDGSSIGFPSKERFSLGTAAGLRKAFRPVLSSSPTGWMALKAQVRPSGKLLEKAKELLPEAHLGPLFTHPVLLKKEAVQKKAVEEGLKPLGVDMEGEFRGF